MIERFKHVKNSLMSLVEGQMSNLAEVDAEELGEVIDMIKDLEEANYYCVITKAMEESEKEGHSKGYSQMQYTPMMYTAPQYMDWDGISGRSSWYREVNNTDGRDGRRYYNGSGNSSSQYSESGQGQSRGGENSSQYTEKEFPHAFQDPREGRSPRSRRMYMESKETHQDKSVQMRELEKYMQELTQDMIEMIEGATSEEKQYLSKKVSALATKLSQLNDQH